MRYCLRFQIIPDSRVESRARSLAKFCQSNSIEEVVLFIAAEEWNNGLMVESELQRWLGALQIAKVILEDAGLVVSLNLWMTVLHTDRGRRMPDELSLECMTSPAGTPSKACASFGDPKFVQYIGSVYRKCAELGFRVLWIEDDFRFRNHAPLEWGGGFEDCVLSRFAKIIEMDVSRQEVVENILRPGHPHPWREVWIQLWGELHCETASAIAGAVADASDGKSLIGLMSSTPSFHSIEGRDWEKLFACLEINGTLVHRPNFAPYEEIAVRYHTHSIQMLAMQRGFRKSHYEVAPEIENFPFTAWTKSKRQTWMEMFLAACSGADALLLDLFSFCGNGVEEDAEDVSDLLLNTRTALEWAGTQFTKSLEDGGFEIWWRQDAAVHVHTVKGLDMSELSVSPFGAGDYLLRHGVPVSFESSDQPVVLFGDSAWCMDEEELHRLILRGLLIDGKAATILCRRGLGAIVGLKDAYLVDREECNYSLEEFVQEIGDVPAGFRLSCNLQPAIAMLEAVEELKPFTWILRADGSRLCPGSLAGTLPNGGRVAIIAATSAETLSPSRQRCRHLRAMLSILTTEDSPLVQVEGGPNLFPMLYVGADANRLVILNGSPDPARPRVLWRQDRDVEAYLVKPLEKPVRADVDVVQQNGETYLECKFEVPHMGFVIIIEKTEEAMS